MGYSPWGLKESDMTEDAHVVTFQFLITIFSDAPLHFSPWS